jgi:hypothetical protein
MSDSASPSEQLPEKFAPPSNTDLASLTDGRRPGEYKTIYPASVWAQIGLELFYLVVFELFCIYALILLALYVLHGHQGQFFYDLVGPYTDNKHLVAYASIGLSGACGGCTFALKWLYHTVAKRQWHRDRLVWRIVVPISSALLAVFSGLMIISGLVPFLARAPLMVPTTGAAYGFFVGLFSDNVLAALQKLAYHVFGTIDKGKATEGSGGPSGVS